jgi:DNA-binding transcriptional regulator YiaG
MVDIIKLRESLGDTQTAFAKRLGVSQSTVSRWETGVEEPSGPALLLLKILSDAPLETQAAE